MLTGYEHEAWSQRYVHVEDKFGLSVQLIIKRIQLTEHVTVLELSTPYRLVVL